MIQEKYKNQSPEISQQDQWPKLHQNICLYLQRAFGREEEASRKKFLKGNKEPEGDDHNDCHRRIDKLAKNMDSMRNVRMSDC